MQRAVQYRLLVAALVMLVLFGGVSAPAAVPIAIDGFGANTTGGWVSPFHRAVRVASLADSGPGTLREAVSGGFPKVVTFAVDGVIRAAGCIAVGSNTTIDGRGSNITITGHGLRVSQAANVIITNITIRNAADDAIEITESSDVVVDHCTLASSGDGLVDIVCGSRGVTVRWCRFEDHNKTILIGSGPGRGATDRHITATIHHCLFINTRERHPRLRFGKVDCFNNHMQRYRGLAMASRCEGELLIENNVFEPAAAGQAAVDFGHFLADWGGYVRALGNWERGCAPIRSSQPERVFSRPYRVDVQPADESLCRALLDGAGARR